MWTIRGALQQEYLHAWTLQEGQATARLPLTILAGEFGCIGPKEAKRHRHRLQALCLQRVALAGRSHACKSQITQSRLFYSAVHEQEQQLGCLVQRTRAFACLVIGQQLFEGAFV